MYCRISEKIKNIIKDGICWWKQAKGRKSVERMECKLSIHIKVLTDHDSDTYLSEENKGLLKILATVRVTEVRTLLII